MRDSSAKPGSIRTGAAALVHAYTASGAVLAFVGTRAVVDGDVRLAFAMMLAATLVDATDGALARLVRIKEVLPSVDGAKIDDLVDYISFVFLPLFLIDMRGGLPARAALPVVAVVLISSAYGFAAVDAKSTDHFFTGFPSYWNIVVFYLMAFRLPPAFNAAALLVLSALIFIRTGYVYPTRTGALRGLTLTLAAFWTALLAWMIWRWPDVPRNLAIGSLLFPVYYFVLSVVLHVRRRVLFA
ncbi:MAG: CDP-alcohol phosphatidyltransferase family protein [Vicinamibacterales bacterium]